MDSNQASYTLGFLYRAVQWKDSPRFTATKELRKGLSIPLHVTHEGLDETVYICLLDARGQLVGSVMDDLFPWWAHPRTARVQRRCRRQSQG